VTDVFGALAAPLLGGTPPLSTPSVADPQIPPGDPGALHAAARGFRGMAGEMDAEANRIISIGSSLQTSWIGTGEIAFLGAAGRAAADCRLAADAFRDASSALSTYATALQDAQDLARKAQQQAASIRQASAFLHSAYDQAASNVNAQLAAGKPVDDSALGSIRSQADQLQADAGGVAAQAEAAAQQAKAAGVQAAGAFQSIAGRVGGLQSTHGAGGGPSIHLPGDGKFWFKIGLSVLGPGGVLPAALAGAGGYRLARNGKYVIVRGQHFGGPGFLEWYKRSGRKLAGTRYLYENPSVLKNFEPGAAARGALADIFNPRSSGFLKNIGKGGGAAAGALTFGGDIYDFGFGANSGKGLLSTDFAATATVDGGLLAGTAVASSAAATALTAGAFGASAGSVVPIAGTAVGFAIGVGVGVFMQTGAGKAVRSGLISGTKHAMDFAIEHPGVALGGTPLAPVAITFEYRHEIVSAAGTAIHVAGDVADGAWDKTSGVRHAVGGFFSHFP
jgi:uncharacterized protein YukE